MGFAGRVFNTVGSRQYQDMKTGLATSVIERIPETSQYIERYAQERLDLENTMIEKMAELTAIEYENLLRPAFRDDEWLVIVLGATLGFLVGELQVQLLLLLAH